jgi:hypothetical protein
MDRSADLPDGSRPADYAYLREVDRAGLMWDWLRRDASYADWYVRASTATRGRLAATARWQLVIAEDPGRPAPEATILWHADLDPGALRATASPTDARNPDALPGVILRRFATLADGADGVEHVVLSDGLRRIRIDIEQGTLRDGPVILNYHIGGTQKARPALLSVRRLNALCLNCRFAPSLFPHDPRIDRWLHLLRVHDAGQGGASQREIAELLFGIERVSTAWSGASPRRAQWRLAAIAG